jgi:hypothetical protein
MSKLHNAEKIRGQTSSARDIASAAAATNLPSDRQDLLFAARECVALYHDAVMSRADFAALVISERYDAIIWKLNGGTFFGCNAGVDSAGPVVSRFCAAAPGTIPLWGQQGEFVISANSVRCWVRYGGGFGPMRGGHFEFLAIDLDGPFISETGYRSHFFNTIRDRAVDQVALEIFADFLVKQRRYLAPEYQDKRAMDQLPEWISALPVTPVRKPAIHELPQLVAPQGYEVVDVVLTAHQAFIVRKWASAAASRIKAAALEAEQHPSTSTVNVQNAEREADLTDKAGAGSPVPDRYPHPDLDAPKVGQR